MLGAGALIVALAWTLSPNTLIELGPLRRSLTSPNELVRETAYLEVRVLRLVLVAIGLSLCVLAFNWKKITKSKWWSNIASHTPELSTCFDLAIRNLAFRSMIVLAIAGAAFVLLAPGNFAGSTIDIVVKEDGVVEYLSALLFLLSSILAVFLLFKYRMPLRHRIILACLSFCLFVFFGEEISWGQRIFGLETIEAFRGLNVQNENNLHNLFGYLFPSLFLLAVIAYGVVLPFAANASRIFQNALDMLGIPIASRGLALGFLIAVLFRDWSFEKIAGNFEFVPSAEIGELLIAFGFLLLVVEIRSALIRYREIRE